MRLTFKATRDKRKHRGRELYFKDGTTHKLDDKRGQRLLELFPDNFFDVTLIPSQKIIPSITPLPTPLPRLKSTPLISILIPQRGRPDYIKKCLELILSNTTYPDYEVILICDRDDIDSIATIPDDNRIKVTIDPSPKRQMYVGKINYGLRISKADYIVYLANDIEVQKNWLTQAMKAMAGVFTDGIGLVALNLGPGSKDAFHGLISRKFVDRYLGGNIFDPDYIHFWCDVELLYVTKKLKKFYLCSASRITHTSPKDTLHKEAWKESYESGHKLFQKRQQKGFPPRKPRKMSDISIITLHHWTEEILKKDLLSHLPPEAEYIQFDNQSNMLFSSAAQGLNYAIKKAKNDIVMCVHEDSYYKKEWFTNFLRQESKLRNWGVIGIVGVDFDSPWHHWGWKDKAPCLARTLDECCLIVNKKNNIWFDEQNFNDWHVYGVDLCLQARNQGLDIYIMNGPGFHDDTEKTYSFPKNYLLNLAHYKKVLRKKWGNKFPKIYTTTGSC